MKKMLKDLINDYYMCKKAFKGTPQKWIPNIISISRLSLLPFVIGLITSGNYLMGAVLAGITAATDGIDGHIARKYDAKSEFGRKLDTIADKLLAFTLGVTLLFNSPIFIVVLAIEGGIAGVNLKAEKKKLQPKTIEFGRIKTVILDIALVLGVANLGLPSLDMLTNILVGTTLVAQTITLGKYIQINKEKKIDENTVLDFNPIVKEEKKHVLTKENYLNMMYPEKKNEKQKQLYKQKKIDK